MFKDIKAIAILVILVLGALFWWHVSHKLAEADKAFEANKALTDRVTELEGKAQRYDQALLDKAAREQDARNDRRNIASELDKVNNDDPSAAAYLRAVIPDSVRDAYNAGASARQPRSEDARAAGADRN